MKTIYITFTPSWMYPDVIGTALCEDGRGLTSHLSSNVSWGKHDMGLTSDWKHDWYDETCPEGWTLEYVEDPDNHEKYKAALKLNKVMAKKSRKK